jgi:hypothetical protein
MKKDLQITLNIELLDRSTRKMSVTPASLVQPFLMLISCRSMSNVEMSEASRM